MVQYIILIAIGLVDLDTDTAMGPIYYLYLTYYHLPDLRLPICIIIIITNLATLGCCRYPQGR